jgi:hypothetical protein
MQTLFLAMLEGFGWTIAGAVPDLPRRWPVWVRLLIVPLAVLVVLATALLAALMVTALVMLAFGMVRAFT